MGTFAGGAMRGAAFGQVMRGPRPGDDRVARHDITTRPIGTTWGMRNE